MLIEQVTANDVWWTGSKTTDDGHSEHDGGSQRLCFNPSPSDEALSDPVGRFARGRLQGGCGRASAVDVHVGSAGGVDRHGLR
jgi:hypothetical protein